MQGLEPFKVTNISPQAALSVCGFSFMPDVGRSLNAALRAFARAYPDFANPSDKDTLPDGYFPDKEMLELRKIIEDHVPQEVKLGMDESSALDSTKITLINKVDPENIPFFSIGVFARGEMKPVRHRQLLRKGPPVPNNYADVPHRDGAHVSVFGMKRNQQQAATTFVNLEAVFKAMEEREEFKYLMDKLCIILPKTYTTFFPDMSTPKPKTMAEIKEDQHRAWIRKLLTVNELHLFIPPDRHSQVGVLQVVDGTPAIEHDRIRIHFMALVHEHKVDITLGEGQVLVVSNGQNPYAKGYPTLGKVYHWSRPGHIVDIPAEAISREMFASIADLPTRTK